LLLTRSMLPGESVYGEELINTAFRVWDPTRSVLAAAILGGINSVHMGPGAKVLYLGAGSGVTASHISDIVDEGGCVYAVEVSPLSGSVLENVADRRPNLIPIIADARNPQAYCSLVGTVDCVFADIAQLDQARIVVLNANLCLKVGGHIVITMKASIHANSPANARTDGWNRTPGYPDYGQEVNHFRTEGFKPVEMITLEPYYEGNAVLTIQRSSVLRQGCLSPLGTSHDTSMFSASRLTVVCRLYGLTLYERTVYRREKLYSTRPCNVSFKPANDSVRRLGCCHDT
jgi:rRNA 2'-O-methyltransferase fibrillarin